MIYVLWKIHEDPNQPNTVLGLFDASHRANEARREVLAKVPNSELRIQWIDARLYEQNYVLFHIMNCYKTSTIDIDEICETPQELLDTSLVGKVFTETLNEQFFGNVNRSFGPPCEYIAYRFEVMTKNALRFEPGPLYKLDILKQIVG